MPPAARLGDMHTCPLVNPGPVPHVGGPILPPCCPTVLIGMMPAARVGDMCVCVGPPDVIAKGSSTVLIGYMPAARIGDSTVHGGVIVVGCPTVIIGDTGGGGGGGGGLSVLMEGIEAILGQLAEKIISLARPCKSNPGEEPLLSWSRLKAEVKLYSKEFFEPGERKPSLEVNYTLKEGALFQIEKEGATTIFGVPVHGTVSQQIGAYEAGAKAGLGKKGVSLGASGEFTAVDRKAEGVVGTKKFGVTGSVEEKELAVEGFIGLKDNQFGAEIGGTLVSVEGAAGINVAGANVGVKGEIGLKAELGFEIGAKGVEVKLPFVTLGITFGVAK